MLNKELFYPNVYTHGYTYSRIENLSYIQHVHMGVEGVYVLSGNVQVTIDKKSYNLRAGDISIVMPYHRHSYMTRNSSDIFAFALLSDDVLVQNPFFSGRYNLPNPIFRKGQYSDSVDRVLGLLLDEQTRQSNMITHIGLLNTLLGYLFDANPPHPIEQKEPTIEDRVLLYLHEYLYKPITLSQAAEDLNISQFKLSRICNQQIGIGFNSYLKSMRVAAAKRRLAFTEFSMAEIAEQCGFESLRTFNRAFSEETGTTPRAYRSTHKDKTSLNFRIPEKKRGDETT